MVTAPLKFKKNNLIILMSKWISWDFDDTLYDPYSGQLQHIDTEMNVRLLKNCFQIFQFLQLEENLKLSY